MTAAWNAWWPALHWHRPAALALALVPWLLAGLGAWRNRRLLGYADPQLHPWAMRPGVRPPGQRRRLLLQGLGWLGLALALAGPWVPAPGTAELLRLQATARQGLHIQVLVQVSDSMRAPRGGESGLDLAATGLRGMLGRLHGESLSLTAYGAQPVLLLPPTRDPALFRLALDGLDTPLAASREQDVFAALALALLRQPDPATQRHAVLLVTDGRGVRTGSPAAGELPRIERELRRRDTPLYVWQVPPPQEPGRPGGWPAGGDDGALLADLATRTGGRLVSLDAGDAGWDALYRQGLANLELAPAETAATRHEHPLHQIPLALGGLCMVLAYTAYSRWTGAAVVALLAAGLWLGGAPARAQAAGPARADAAVLALERQAWQALQAQQWLAAMQAYERVGGFRGHWGAGQAALQGRRPEEARQHFEMAWLLAPDPGRRSDALYNLGLALASQQRWDAAAQTWEQVLAQRPSDRDAAHNLRVAREWLARHAQRGGPQDLYGRRGYLAEGRVQTDGVVPDMETAAPPGNGAGGEAVTAVRPGAPGAALQAQPRFELSDAHRRAARLKVERLQEQAGALQLGLMRRQAVRPQEPRLGQEAP